MERQWTIGEFEGHEVGNMMNKRVGQEQRPEMAEAEMVAEREVDIGCTVGHMMVHGGW